MRVFILFLECIYWLIMGFCAVVDWIRKNPGRTPEERREIALRSKRELDELHEFHRRMDFLSENDDTNFH